jgi:hypothetical protein
MSFLDFLWIFLIITSLQPPWAALAEMQRQRPSGGRGAARQPADRPDPPPETMSFLGFPSRASSTSRTRGCAAAIQLTDPTLPIDLSNTPGGLSWRRSRSAGAERHQGKVTVLVPHYAMSGGSLIALAADEIVMAENAFSPVDPQIGQHPAASILTAVSESPWPR